MKNENEQPVEQSIAGLWLTSGGGAECWVGTAVENQPLKVAECTVIIPSILGFRK